MRVSAGEVVYPPGGTLGPRRQHDIELVLVHRGSARVLVDDGPPLTLPLGAVGLLLPGHRESFEFGAREETHHSWVQLGVSGPVPAQIVQAPRSLPASTPLTELVRAAVAAEAERLAASLTVAAIWRYVVDAETGTEGAAGPVDRARRYLDLRLADPELNLERVAAAAHVAPAHLVRRFRAELGITPIAYLWRRRAATGIELLTNTGLAVGDVARRSGFKSVYHFSRRIKQDTGLPPTELRGRSWSSPSAR